MIVGIIIAVWLLCPLPEISILIGFFGGTTIHNYFNLPAWSAYAGSLTGALIGYLIMRYFGWIERMKVFLKEKIPEGIKYD